MPARPVAADCYIFQLVFRNDRSLTRMGDNEAAPELHRLLTPNDSHFGDFTGTKNIKSRNAWRHARLMSRDETVTLFLIHSFFTVGSDPNEQMIVNEYKSSDS